MYRKSRSVLPGDFNMNSEERASGTNHVDIMQPTGNQSWQIEAGFNAEGKSDE